MTYTFRNSESEGRYTQHNRCRSPRRDDHALVVWDALDAGRSILNWHTFEGTEAEARELAELLNDKRRHLTPGARAEWVAKLRAKGMSTRAIADAVGVDQKTIRNDLKAGEDNSSPAPEQSRPRPLRRRS